jgi:Fic family protein
VPYLESPPQLRGLTKEVVSILATRPEVLLEVNAEYPYWTKAKYAGRRYKLDPKDIWAALKYARNANAEQLKLTETFSFNTTPNLQRELHELDKHCGGSLQAIATVPDNLRERFIISSLVTEAFSSSVLEGAVATRDRAKELIRQAKKPRNKSEQMIFNNYMAMEFIRENKNKNLTIELLLELHEILSKGALDQGEPGEFRNLAQDVVVLDDYDSEVIYTPPVANQIESRISELIQFFNYKEEAGTVPFAKNKFAFVHPIIRATIIHFMIGYIHPFADGNGRIARGLFYWHMLKNGYWLAEYLSISQVILESKNQYYKAFVQVEQDENDLTYFLNYHTKALSRSFVLLKEYLNRKLNQQRTEVFFEAVTLNITPRQAELLTEIRKTPSIWTVAQAETYLNVSHATARGDLNALAEKGLLQKVAIDKKTQAWRLP